MDLLTGGYKDQIIVALDINDTSFLSTLVPLMKMKREWMNAGGRLPITVNDPLIKKRNETHESLYRRSL